MRTWAVKDGRGVIHSDTIRHSVKAARVAYSNKHVAIPQLEHHALCPEQKSVWRWAKRNGAKPVPVTITEIEEGASDDR